MAHIADCHAHSLCSPDGRATMADMAAAALAAGVQTFTLTDHHDMLTLNGPPRTPVYDWAPTLAARREMLAKFEGRLELPLGLEFGTPQLDRAAARVILAQPELDFVIGSLHNRSEAAGGLDYSQLAYPDQAACHQALDDYFSLMEDLAPTDLYDVLGHIIYPLRYMETQGRTVSLAPYMGRIRDILRTAVEGGRGIELNTNRGKTVAQWAPILTLYRSVGGEIVTLGSDAHVPQHVGLGIPEGLALLAACGFRYSATYRRRKPVFHAL